MKSALALKLTGSDDFQINVSDCIIYCSTLVTCVDALSQGEIQAMVRYVSVICVHY